MVWNMEEALAYYKTQGAPREQSALVALLKETQQENGGSIPQSALVAIADGYQVKESYLTAVIRRIPSLRLDGLHVLEICAGPNCGKHAAIAAYAESLKSETLSVKFVPCMRQCAKGPNIRYDGRLHHRADEGLLQQLIGEKRG